MNSRYRITIGRILTGSLCLLVLTAGAGLPPMPMAAPADETYDHHGVARRLPDEVRFNAHIRPVMSNTCFVCHGNDESQNDSGLRLDSRASAVDEGGAIEPGDASGSAVYQRIRDADDPMPPAGFRHQLSDYEKALLGKWIDQGAEYEQHWAWAPLQRPDIPDVNKYQDRIATPVDAFVLARLEAEGIAPAPQADRATLLRRLSLDLTGLPPTTDELDAFLADRRPDAWQRQVERLLASPHYGERMAARWLDLVRFSDTVGFHGDQNQRIFPYRDYVIQSINDNQPFDQFTREQLAGDLLDEPGESQLVATGLVRLNMVTREGGAQPAEYLAKYSADRVRMVGTTWLGATTGCCECHDHKYDPFTSKDFYSLGAFFDDVRQWGVYSDYGYTPNPDLKGFNNDYPFPPEMRLPSPSLEAQIQFLEQRLDRQAADLLLPDALESAEFDQWLNQLVASFQANRDLWQLATPENVTVDDGQTCQILDDGSILLTGDPASDSADKQTISVSLQPRGVSVVRALQLEVLPDETHDGHVGRAADGHFATQFSVTHHPGRNDDGPEPMTPVRPRYVRLELDGQRILSLAEVQVFAKSGDDQESNIALAGAATQSSVAHEGEALRAVDGNTEGDYHKGNSVTHTRQEQNPWWEIDLGTQTEIDRIQIWNRTDGDYPKRLAGLRVLLLDADRQPVWRHEPPLPEPSAVMEIPREFPTATLRLPETIALGQVDRSTPNRFSSGRAPRFLQGPWRSGPANWQLPRDETRLPHSAVYHLDRPLSIGPQDRLEVKLQSGDVGRIRLSLSPHSRFVVGGSSLNPDLQNALEQIVGGKAVVDLPVVEQSAVASAWYQFATPISEHDPRVVALRNSVADCYSGLAMTLVSQPVEPDKIPAARVLPRGDWQDKTGQPVVPNTPHFLAGYQAEPPRRLTRLDLANWLTSADNPVVARHYVNRTWKHFFGTGLSGVLDDLGNQGQWPSHPQLLDWLASEFRENWDRKHITRLIVNSSTYRQSAAVRQDLVEIDPWNRLLAQQSARRLEAEIVRDNALAISGLLLTGWIGGPSVHPPQPAGHYANLQFPNRRYVADTDGRQYRRGVYMHWQRTFLHPMLTNFDAPARDECAADRIVSNSPQQALTLLNDPVFVQAALAFAVRLIREQPAADFSQRLTNAYRIALAREPASAEIESLRKLYDGQLEYYTANPADARAFAHNNAAGESIPEMPVTELAAWAQVCRVILNLHETITRY